MNRRGFLKSIGAMLTCAVAGTEILPKLPTPEPDGFLLTEQPSAADFGRERALAWYGLLAFSGRTAWYGCGLPDEPRIMDSTSERQEDA